MISVSRGGELYMHRYQTMKPLVIIGQDEFCFINISDTAINGSVQKVRELYYQKPQVHPSCYLLYRVGYYVELAGYGVEYNWGAVKCRFQSI